MAKVTYGKGKTCTVCVLADLINFDQLRIRPKASYSKYLKCKKKPIIYRYDKKY
jgi:hypothetical protein